MDAKDYIVIPGDVDKPSGEMEDFKRPNHPDFMTTLELRKDKFTGLRYNSITEDCEIWLCGYLERVVSRNDVKINPYAIDEAYAETFHLDIACRPNIPEVVLYREMLAKKGLLK